MTGKDSTEGQGTSYIVPVGEKTKTFIFYKNNNLENWFDCRNIPPFESHSGFALNSTNLSPTTNSEPQSYHYPGEKGTLVLKQLDD
jgi:hypothetical protein